MVPVTLCSFVSLSGLMTTSLKASANSRQCECESPPFPRQALGRGLDPDGLQAGTPAGNSYPTAESRLSSSDCCDPGSSPMDSTALNLSPSSLPFSCSLSRTKLLLLKKTLSLRIVSTKVSALPLPQTENHHSGNHHLVHLSR